MKTAIDLFAGSGGFTQAAEQAGVEGQRILSHEGQLKIVAVSDLHGYLPVIPECDLLLIAGDICPVTNHETHFQKRWLSTAFKIWLDGVPAKNIVGVAGNHDLIFEAAPDSVPELPWHYLVDESVEIGGLTIYGLPWQKRFFDWAFNLDKPELDAKYDAIPNGVDVIVSHGPPYGFGDRAPRGELCGSMAFLKAIERVKPKLAVYGHIHEGHGVYNYDGSILANVTHVDGRYRPIYEPRVFEI